ncbi:MAG: PAS domain S-box protein, partial [Solirubrobacteraceae bacterium]
GHSFAEVKFDADRDVSADSLNADLGRATGSAEYEKRYVTHEGRVIWVRIRVSPATGPEAAGAVHRPAGSHETAVVFPETAGGAFHVAQIEDITQRKEAEQQLADERRLLNAFLDTTPDQVYFKDLNSRFLRVSAAQATRLGFASAGDAVGKTDFDAFAPEHARQALQDERQIMRTCDPLLNIEERETFPDGSVAWVSTTKLPLRDGNGTVIGTYGVSHDVTTRRRAEQALRESEERWRTLLAHAQEIVMLVGSDRLIEYTSPSIERWLGYRPEEATAAEFTFQSHPDDSPALQRAFDEVGPSAPFRLGHRVRHKDGSWHSLESTLVCLRDDPAIGGVLITSTDVTERVALERERERLDLQRRVSQRLEAVGQLAAGVAHEINTPLQFVSDSMTFVREAIDELLTLIGLYRELLYTDAQIGLSERRRTMLEAEDQADIEYLLDRIPSAFQRTMDGIARVTSIVQAMKRFSHPASSEMAPADLNDAIETTLVVCRNEYKYVADVESRLGELPLVNCNIGEFNQVLLNLIINAAQAIEEGLAGCAGRGTITISTRVDGDTVVIEVADDGPGIPPEHLDRIYEPFFTTKEVGKGSGQGLALARTIVVEQHKGSLECASAPGEGTKFTVRLPLQAPTTLAHAA